MGAATISSNAVTASWWQNIIEECWGDELGKDGPTWPKYLDEVSTTKKYFEDGEIAGPGLWGQTGEGEDLLLDDFGEGIKTRYEPQKFSKRLIIPEEFEEDMRYPEMYDASRMLADSCKTTQDYEAVGILNDAFTGANGHVGGDGLAYISASHPLRGGSTFSNLMAPVSPSNTAVGTMLITADRLPGSNGLMTAGAYKLKNIVGPSAYKYRFGEILKSGQKDDTANNAINAIKGELQGYVSVRFMASTTNWFGKTDVKRGALWVWRRKPRFRNESMPQNETKVFMGSARWTQGVTNVRTFIGVNI
jgi:hypothetical protein